MKYLKISLVSLLFFLPFFYGIKYTKGEFSLSNISNEIQLLFSKKQKLKFTYNKSVDPRILILEGVVCWESIEEFKRIIQEYPKITTICFNRYIGAIDFFSIIQLCYMVRKCRMNTVLLRGVKVDNVALLLFLSGKNRKVCWPSIIDQSFDGYVDIVGESNIEKVERFMCESGISNVFITRFLEEKAGEECRLSSKEIVQYGIGSIIN
ncbi:hypothetical protein K5X82_01560 [Halosquirtibacter xylanolyticus]|uniref:hypothetical protein n=1 Tax=Halosquirtibacter xylanolyticus TaxID=3374599 RepID=UPI0037485AC7|nr:hypothetical protein K5X82_01560 [Prolixibacteraceae bacterium]